MISISSHLKRTDSVQFLESLAFDHWSKINAVCVNGKYRKNSLRGKLEKFLFDSETVEYFKRYADLDHAKLRRQQDFFQLLIDFDGFYLQEIIISKPDELTAIRADLMQVIREEDLYEFVKGSAAQTPFGALLSEKLFSYKSFRSSSACLALIRAIGFGSTTCPYCNYNKLDLVPNLGTPKVVKNTTAYLDLDHFFAKVQNPFFALSFFNLIPSCHSCNSIDKGPKLFLNDTHIHPYFESFDDYFKFRVSLVSLLGCPIDEVSIDSIVPRPNDRTVNDFNLVAKYTNNLSDAKSLIDMFMKYKYYIGTKEEAMFVDMLMLNVPQRKENILLHTSAKFKRDILAQLDISNALKMR
jgi:hypothetical protein